MRRVLGLGVAIAALAAIVILAVPAVRHLREVPPPPSPAIRLSLTAPPGAELGSGDQTLDAAVSPDDRQIVFVATVDGTAALWRRTLTSERAERIAGTDGAQLPTWKQTGNVIAFFANNRLKQVALPDGEVRDLAAAGAALGASWLPDGSLLFAADARGAIRRLRDGRVSDATTLRAGDRTHAFPVAAGSGDSFVYTATLASGGRAVRLVDAAGEQSLVTTNGHGQLVGDTLVYVRDGVLLGQHLNFETRQLSGRSVPLALDVGASPSGQGHFTASPRVLVAAAAGSRQYQLTWIALGSGQRTSLREPGSFWQVRLAPDERFAALTQTTPLVRTLDVVVAPLTDADYLEQVTRAVAADSDPVWSPDGRMLAYRSLQDGPPRLFTHLAHDPEAADTIVPMSTSDETPTDWRNGRLVAHGPGAKGDFDLVAVNVETGAREAIANTGFNESDGRLSPDGRWLAYVSDESGQADVYAAPFPRGPRVRVSFAGGSRPRWGRDGRSLFFLRANDLMRADMSGADFITPRSVATVAGLRDYDVSWRRDAFLALLPVGASRATVPAVIVDWRSLMK